MNQKSPAVLLSEKIGGKIRVVSKTPLIKENLSILYTPGVADVASAISQDPSLPRQYTIKKN